MATEKPSRPVISPEMWAFFLRSGKPPYGRELEKLLKEIPRWKLT